MRSAKMKWETMNEIFSKLWAAIQSTLTSFAYIFRSCTLNTKHQLYYYVSLWMKNGISDERNETKCERKKEKNNFVCIFPTAEVWFGAANCNTISVGMKSELCRMCTVAIRKRNASSLSFNHSQSTCVFSGRCLRVNMAENSIQRFVAVANHHRTTANEYVWIFSFIDFSLAIEWSDEWKKTHTRRSVDALMSFCSFSPSLSSSVCVCVFLFFLVSGETHQWYGDELRTHVWFVIKLRIICFDMSSHNS